MTTVTTAEVNRLLEQYEALNGRADRLIDRYVHDLVVREDLHNLAGVRRLEIDAHSRGAYSYDDALRVLRARLGAQPQPSSRSLSSRAGSEAMRSALGRHQ